ncbi:hypothetical protein BGY98DRAFT_593954 [Russula aff. rugulosa BPL654]|nr:hypothetical protein BGY98DRAFT_593954 [Russula aff. rugulosa BPL654]
MWNTKTILVTTSTANVAVLSPRHSLPLFKLVHLNATKARLRINNSLAIRWCPYRPEIIRQRYCSGAEPSEQRRCHPFGSHRNHTCLLCTAASPERENLASTLNGSFAPLASTGNTEATGQPQAPVKRARGLAVMGTGLTDKNFCMKDWLHENPTAQKSHLRNTSKPSLQTLKRYIKIRQMQPYVSYNSGA